jgi:hypothetical protein
MRGIASEGGVGEAKQETKKKKKEGDTKLISFRGMSIKSLPCIMSRPSVVSLRRVFYHQ